MESREYLKWLSPHQDELEEPLDELFRKHLRGCSHLAAKVEEEWLVTSPRVFWVIGTVGVGKSMLASKLVGRIFLQSDVVLLYFFQREKVESSNPTRDILRSLSYQLCEHELAVLDDLQHSFPKSTASIFNRIEFSDLFDRLITKPLGLVKKEKYIIIDGLDAIHRKSNVELLVEHLYQLSDDVHVIFFSQFEPEFLDTLETRMIGRNLITARAGKRHIEPGDNDDDIKSYVKATLNLKRMGSQVIAFFKSVEAAIKFFIEHSKGMFLWVTLILNSFLDAITDQDLEDRYEEAVKTAPDEVSRIYGNALTRFAGDPGELASQDSCHLHSGRGPAAWAKEALLWVIGAKRTLSIAELHAAIRFIMDGNRLWIPFEEFLRINCSSLLLVSTRPDKNAGVSMIHESLRSFLEGTIAGKFQMDEMSIDAYLVTMCLQFLTTEGADAQTMRRYSATNWISHLHNVRTKRFDQVILKGIYKLFNSHNLRIWVEQVILLDHQTPATPAGEIADNVSNIIYTFLEDVDDDSILKENVNNLSATDTIRAALDWKNGVRHNRRMIETEVAKAAAYLWAYEELEPISAITNALSIAFKYYPPEQSQSFKNQQADQNKWTSFFSELRGWIDSPDSRPVNEKNEGISYIFVKEDDVGIKILERVDPSDAGTLVVMGDVYIKNGIHEKANERFERAHRSDPTNSYLRVKLAAAYLLSGCPGLAQGLYGPQPDSSDSNEWRVIGDVYRAGGLYELAKDAYSQSLYFEPWNLWAAGALAAVYRVMDRADWSRNVAQRAVDLTHDSRACACLGDAYKAIGEFKWAINCYKEGIWKDRTCIEAWQGLADACITRQLFDVAEKEFKRESEKTDCPWWIWTGLGDIYRAWGSTHSRTTALAAYRKGTKCHPTDSWALTCLGDFYRTQPKDYNAAIDNFRCAIQKNPLDAWPQKGLAEVLCAVGKREDAKDRYKEAIKRVPQDYSLQISLAKLYIEDQERRDEKLPMAKVCFEHAVRLCPSRNDLEIAFIHLPSSPFRHEYPGVPSLDARTCSSFFWFDYLSTVDASRATSLCNQIIQAYERALKNTERGIKNNLMWVYSGYLGSLGFDVFETKQTLSASILRLGIALAAEVTREYPKAIEEFENLSGENKENVWLKTKLEDIRSKTKMV